MTNVQVAREKLMNDFHEIVTDSEQLLKSVQSAGGDKAHVLRENLEHKVKAVRERLAQLEATVARRARATARATDEYVHVHPWQSITVAAALGGVLGLTAGLLMSRR